MNKERRKQIDAVRALIDQFDEARQALYEAIDEIAGAESDAFDNMPESLQEGDRGQAVEAARDALYEARDFFDNLDLSEARDALDTASE